MKVNWKQIIAVSSLGVAIFIASFTRGYGIGTTSQPAAGPSITFGGFYTCSFDQYGNCIKIYMTPTSGTPDPPACPPTRPCSVP